MTAKVVVGPGRYLVGLPPGGEGRGVRHPDNPPHVGGGEPSLLVVIVSRQLPSIFLQYCHVLSLHTEVFKDNRATNIEELPCSHASTL